MSKAKIFYFTLQDEQTKEEKLEWFEHTQFEQIPFDHITPDQKENWINLTDNDFDSFLPLIDKEVKAGRSQEAVFQLFSAGVKTQRDEWVYDFSKEALIKRMKYFVEVYQNNIENVKDQKLDIKWDDDLSRYLGRRIKKYFDASCITRSQYRPFSKRFIYFDRHFNARTYQWFDIFNLESSNISIAINVGNPDFACLGSDLIFDLATLKFGNGITQCLPIYRYDENGNRIDNITDWALEQFRRQYLPSPPAPSSPAGEEGAGTGSNLPSPAGEGLGVRDNPPPGEEGTGTGSNLPSPAGEGLGVREITKLDIFHYTYAVLHHPAYRTKYEINLKREFPRLPFYANFHQWAAWGKALMELHLNYETIEPYGLRRVDVPSSPFSRKRRGAETPEIPGLEPPLPSAEGAKSEGKPPKAKLKADKIEGKIILDTDTSLEGVPAVAWDYKLGNRSALEWILDQYKEKTPKDPTIAKLFNTYKFADYKEHVIDLLDRVCTVSVKTMEIIQQMPTE